MANARLSDFESRTYVPSGLLRMHEVHNGAWTYRAGWWRGPAGIVGVHDFFQGNDPSLMLETVRDGRLHWRNWRGVYCDRTISRLCREFAESVG